MLRNELTTTLRAGTGVRKLSLSHIMHTFFCPIIRECCLGVILRVLSDENVKKQSSEALQILGFISVCSRYIWNPRKLFISASNAPLNFSGGPLQDF